MPVSVLEVPHDQKSVIRSLVLMKCALSIKLDIVLIYFGILLCSIFTVLFYLQSNVNYE